MEQQPINLIEADYTSLAFLVFGRVYEEHFLREYDAPADRIRKNRLKYCRKDEPLREENAVAVLKDILQDYEQEMQRRISEHSTYYWLHIYRRVGPWPVENDDKVTTLLYRNTLELALIKYGRTSKQNEFQIVANDDVSDLYNALLDTIPGNESFRDIREYISSLLNSEKIAIGQNAIPRRLTYEDFLGTYQLERLARAYYQTTKSLRTVWKGARLAVDSSSLKLLFLDPDNLANLIKLFDERTEKDSSLLHEFGSVTQISVKEPSEFTILVPIFNVHRIKLNELLTGVKLRDPYYPNFHLVPVSLEEYYKKLMVFRDQIEGVHHFTPEQIVSYFLALNWCITSRLVEYTSESTYLLYMLYQRGYWLSKSIDTYIQAISPIFLVFLSKYLNKEIDHKEAVDIVTRLTDYLTWKNNQKKEISLHDRRPVRMIFNTQYGILVDFSNIPFTLASFINELASRAGKVGHLKGNSFNDEVIEYLKEKVSNLEFWLCKEEVEFEDGTETDIDVSFYVKEVLFIIECKAYPFDRALDRGEPNALDKRRKQISKDIKKLQKICRKIAEGTMIGFSIPKSVRVIVPLLCLPCPSYIHRYDDRYFVTTNCPRVCVPREIVEFIQSGMLSEIKENEYNLLVER